MLDTSAFDLRGLIRGNTQTTGVWIALVALLTFGLIRYENWTPPETPQFRSEGELLGLMAVFWVGGDAGSGAGWHPIGRHRLMRTQFDCRAIAIASCCRPCSPT